MPPRKNKNHTRWHGAIQAITVSIALLLCAGLAYLTILGMLPIYDAILLGETLLAFAIALICSHAYNYYPGTEKEGSLREEAAKLKAMWLHYAAILYLCYNLYQRQFYWRRMGPGSCAGLLNPVFSTITWSICASPIQPCHRLSGGVLKRYYSPDK